MTDKKFYSQVLVLVHKNPTVKLNHYPFNTVGYALLLYSFEFIQIMNLVIIISPSFIFESCQK